MPTVLILQHGRSIPPGHLGAVLTERGFRLVTAHLDEGASIPDGDWAGIVSLGGVMGAYEEPDHPWLVEEKRYLAGAVDHGVPVMGVCLGAQILADALGGMAYRSETGPEIGVMGIEPTAEGLRDPVVGDIGLAPVPVWHFDTFDLPPGATLLARTDRFPHAFRAGSAYAIQAHPEATPEIVDGWIESPEGSRQLAGAGIDQARFAAEVEAAAIGTQRVANRVFGAWAEGL